MKILNLYAGIGGNRKLWGGDIEITAVELNSDIAKIYQDFFPNDNVIVGDAHQYLLDHFQEYDFIWSSPPCPTHSRPRKWAHHQNPPIYPDMKLYEEILLLEGYFKKRWVVENVISWYDPLINPYLYKEHYYWSNFFIGGSPKEREYRQFHTATIKEMQNKLGIDISKYKGINKQVVLRNCVEPKDGLHIFNLAMEIDTKLDTEQYSLFK
tara:strand:- start:3693 stop:4322 length:630 start_codon:yes stop_codon:yes gene_type:complete